jgi:hypothetical protein
LVNWRLNLGFGLTGACLLFLVLLEASITGGKLLLLEWKGSPSALLSTSFRKKKGIEGFLRTLVHWLPICFENFRCYFTWSCSFMIATTLYNACGMIALVAFFRNNLVGCSSPFGQQLSTLMFFYGSLLLVLVVVHGVYCSFASWFKFLCVYSALAVAQGDSLPWLLLCVRLGTLLSFLFIS